MPEFDVDVAVTLYPDGKIKFFYGNFITPATGWSSGVSQGDGNSYLINSIAGSMNIPAGFAEQIASQPFPIGMHVTPGGIFQGIPTEADMTWNIAFKVTDYNRISSVRVLPFSTVLSAVADHGHGQDQRVSVSPNPFTTKIDLRIHGKSGLQAVFTLHDIHGKMICTIFDGEIPAGQNSISWPVSAVKAKLASGTLFLHWTIGGESGVEKVVYNN
ncbi:MAG: hypothetical protein NTW16_17415 [Bacteroidetes bacterium]|nr:hypothetical protein [Bacteroidota bacterium]